MALTVDFEKELVIIGNDVCDVALQFLKKGRMLGIWNSSRITLLSKVDELANASNYRHIAYCDTLYKCISKKICKVGTTSVNASEPICFC